MSAFYDKFDYPSYWTGRDYEHKSELIAISAFLSKIKSITNLLEIGSGYGRLTPAYLHRAKKIFLSDPSLKLLSQVSGKIKSKKIQIIHSSLNKLDRKVINKKIDLIIMVRVLHHIKNIRNSFQQIYNLLNPKGYVILEFANKLHSKSIFKEILKGNFTVFYDIFPKDVRSIQSIKSGCIGFNNYHPGYLIEMLKETGFTIIEVRSVSNIRSSFLKKHIPLESLCALETRLQKIFASIYFGPSTFVLARKK